MGKSQRDSAPVGEEPRCCEEISGGEEKKCLARAKIWCEALASCKWGTALKGRVAE